MSGKMRLNEASIKTKVKVVGITEGSKIRRRIMDMGITRGAQVYIEGKAPMGDPIEISVRGYNLTLRKNEAKDIIVEKVE